MAAGLYWVYMGRILKDILMGFSKVKKAYYYFKRNGLKDTLYASAERLLQQEDYVYSPISEEEKYKQRQHKWTKKPLFSIVVPTFETKKAFLTELLDSVLSQTYSNWELVIADASKTDVVKECLLEYVKDSRIRYIKLKENKGISANTNAGIIKAKGDYIGLLDHDDVITADALFEFALMIEEGEKNGLEYAFIYSDEDKCDTNGKKFFEPNIKPGFNLDLILTNNYICHFLMLKGRLMKNLLLRESFDGAQDHDLVLRAYSESFKNGTGDKTIAYGHIPKVLYHWRCHEESTASNPESKTYAYEAGKRAIADYLKRAGIRARVEKIKHNGFFRVEYEDYLDYSSNNAHYKRKIDLTKNVRGRLAYTLFLNRYDIGGVGGPLVLNNKITGGLIDDTKTCPFDGLNVNFSGYMHRASLQQGGYGVDIRNMMVSEALGHCVVEIGESKEFLYLFNRNLIKELDVKIKQKELNSPYIDVTALLSEAQYEDFDYINASIALCEKIALEGYGCYYDPLFRLEV